MHTESGFDPTIVFGPHPPVAFVGDSTPATAFLSFVMDPSPLYLDFGFDDVGSVTINGSGLHRCHPYRDISQEGHCEHSKYESKWSWTPVT